MSKPAQSQAAAAVKQMMSKRQLAREEKRRAKLAGVAPGGVDFGAPMAVQRGLVEIEPAALIPDDPSDKNSLAQRGARAQRVWAPDRLLRSGRIEHFQHLAATRLYEDYLIGEHGARPGDFSGIVIRGDPWDRTPFSEQQAIRRQSFRFAVRAIASPIQMAVLTWAVLQETGGPSIPPTLEGFAAQMTPKKWTTDIATGVLIAALEALAAHYGFSAKEQPHDRERRA